MKPAYWQPKRKVSIYITLQQAISDQKQRVLVRVLKMFGLTAVHAEWRALDILREAEDDYKAKCFSEFAVVEDAKNKEALMLKHMGKS